MTAPEQQAPAPVEPQFDEEQFARRATRRERDIEDIVLDAAENPSRQLLYDGWRFYETVKGVGTRFGTKDSVLDYVQGVDQ